MSKIQNLIFSNGERYPILIGANGIPDYWVTLYVTELLRQSHTQSAIINIIYHIIHFKLWEEINKRNLIEEFRELKFLNLSDVYSIRDHCMTNSKSLKNWAKTSHKTNIKFPSASTSIVPPIQTVSKNHAANRLVHIASFLDMTARTILRNRLFDVSVNNSINEMKRSLIANKPKGAGPKNSLGFNNVKAPPPEAFERILNIVKEDSPDNPFKNKKVRFRNALIFEVLESTGMRAGEILGLQIEDIDTYDNLISVRIRHDAIEDTRQKQPVAKTCERRIPVLKIITERLREYIMVTRAKTEGARKHPYVFVTHKSGKYCGRPLSNSTFINRILKPAIAVHPEILEEVTRHGFRHHFNYKISKKIDLINQAAKNNPKIKPFNEKKEMQIRNELNGWRSNQTSEIYNSRYIKEEADKFMRDDIEYWTKLSKMSIN